MKMQIEVDLSNNTKYPDVQKYLDCTPGSVAYIHTQFWVVQFLALVGNSGFIYLSVKDRSINFGRITSTLLENLAVADLMMAVIGGWTAYITFTAKRWVLGRVWCVLALKLLYCGGTAEVLILAAISLHRASLLKDPFLLAGISTMKIRMGICMIWITALLPSAASLLAGSVVYYEPANLACVSSIRTSSSGLVIALLSLLMGVPIVSILLSNVYLLLALFHYKRRCKARSNSVEDVSSRKAVLMVCLVCWVFLFSWSPYVVKVICDAFKVDLPRWFFIFQAHFLSLNIVSNPIIYTITNTSIREAVEMRVFRVLGSFRCLLFNWN